MAATGIGNPAGAIQIFDRGAPAFIGGQARASIVSGGVFVFGSTATAVVSSGTNSFVLGDALFAKDASGTQFNGIALATAGSNQPISVANDGFFILTCNGSVTAGIPVECDGNNSVRSVVLYGPGSELSVLNMAVGAASRIIGRAVTDGASGGYALVHIIA